MTVPPPSSAYTVQCPDEVSVLVFPGLNDNIVCSGLLAEAASHVDSFLAITCTGDVHVFALGAGSNNTSNGVTITDNNVTNSYKVKYTKHRYVGSCRPGLDMSVTTNVVWCGQYLVCSRLVSFSCDRDLTS